jgi:hypothetical protein
MKCGFQLPDGSAFCSKCGAPTGGQAPGFQAAGGAVPKTHRVTIFRESQMFLINPPVNVSINGVKSMSVENGQRLELNLPEGQYRFDFTLHVRSRAVDVFVNRDILITLKWDRITGALKATVM